MKNFSMILYLLFILLLVGCSQESKQEGLSEVNVEELKKSLSIGFTKKEVKELLGKPDDVARENSLETGDKGNPEYWRYDFPTEGYSFDANTPDDIDLEGLQKGDMKIQLRLAWTSDFPRKLGSCSIFYKDNNGLIYWYHYDDTDENYSVYEPESDSLLMYKNKIFQLKFEQNV